MSLEAEYSDLSQVLRELEADFIVEICPARGRVLSDTLMRASSAEDWPPREEETAEEQVQFAQALARAYAAGVHLSFQGLFAGERRERISIPAYPFQRRSFWVRQQSGIQAG